MSKIQSIKKNLFLILCISLLIWTMIMYNDYSAMLPFFMFIMILMMEGLLFLAGVSRKKVFIKIHKDMQQSSDSFCFEVCVSGKSIYPFKMTRLDIEINRKYKNDIISRNVEIPMNGKGEQSFSVSVDKPGCGYIAIKAKSVRIYDALGIFSKKYKKVNPPVEVVLLPPVREMFIDLEQVPYVEADESEVFAKDRRGDDSSELFEVRQFIDGDSLNKVHWKLTARTDDTMVREFSMPMESNVYVYIDLYRNSDIDQALQNGMSAAYELMAAEIPFFMCWFDEMDMCMRRQQPKNYEEIDEVMCRILRLNLFDRNAAIDEILNQFSNEAHVVYPIFQLPESF